MDSTEPPNGLANIPPMAPEPMPTAPRVVEHGSRVLAVVSMATGMISLLCCFLPVTVVVAGAPFALIAMIIGVVSVKLNRPGRGMAAIGQITGLIGVGLIVLLPMLYRSRELARRVVCGTNLNAIGKGFDLYMQPCGDSFPWIANEKGMRYDAPLRTAADVYALDGNAAGPGTDCNILQNLCLLVKTGVVSWKVFRCPSVGTELMGRDSNSQYGFQWDERYQTNYIDYAYHIGYTNTVDGENAARLYGGTDGGMPILADRAPSATSAMNDFYPTQSGSPNRGDGWNHRAEGVQVLTASGAVFWSDKTIRSGLGKNNLYLRDMDTVGNVITPQGMKMPVAGKHSPRDSVLFWSQ